MWGAPGYALPRSRSLLQAGCRVVGGTIPMKAGGRNRVSHVPVPWREASAWSWPAVYCLRAGPKIRGGPLARSSSTKMSRPLLCLATGKA